MNATTEYLLGNIACRYNTFFPIYFQNSCKKAFIFVCTFIKFTENIFLQSLRLEFMSN